MRVGLHVFGPMPLLHMPLPWPLMAHMEAANGDRTLLVASDGTHQTREGIGVMKS